MEFHSITIADKDILSAAFRSAPDRGCEYTFGNLYIWRKVYETKVAYHAGFWLVRFDKVTNSYLFPVGTGDLPAVMEELISNSQMLNIPFHMVAARKEDCEELEKCMPGRFSFHPCRDFAEYIYEANDLIGLHGKKYHAKRNHISKFMSKYACSSFEEISEQNIEEVKEFNNAWYASIHDKSESLAQEHIASACALESFFDLEFSGGLIRVDNKVAAFSIGEPMNQNTFCTHIEKADYAFDGVYSVINQRFYEHFCRDFSFINREDDVGDEGLRRSKLSYYPVTIAEKYVIKLK